MKIHPIGMRLSLIYLGEHYLIDILLGWVYAAAAISAVNWGFERWRRRDRKPPKAEQVGNLPAEPSRTAEPTVVGR